MIYTPYSFLRTKILSQHQKTTGLPVDEWWSSVLDFAPRARPQSATVRQRYHGLARGASFFALFFVFFCLSGDASAVTLSSNSYTVGAQILVTAFTDPESPEFIDNSFELFDLTSGTNLGGVPGSFYDLASVGWNAPFPVGEHNYSIIEVTLNGACEGSPLDTYAQCKARPEYVNEFLFSVKSPAEVSSIPKGIIAHRPEVTINFPKTGDFIGTGTTTIKYLAEDLDNSLYPPFGFGVTPIDIYYSLDRENWIRIKEKEKNLGEFFWNTGFLSEGEYWLKIRARDESGESDEEISGPFGLDSVPPLFDVSVDPAISKGESVKITIKSSEPLKESPEVFVRQRGYVDIQVFPRPVRSLARTEGASPEDLGEATSNGARVAEDAWEGVYEVRSGADGTAKISIKGKDRAENVGTAIRKGGFFSVGSAPPPTPVIISPLDNEVSTSSAITVRGRIREDTMAVIFVNDAKAGNFEPNSEGEFIAENIVLSKDANRGLNLIKIFSEDAAGNTSEPAVLSVKFNLAPKLSILEPLAGATTSATTTIIMEGRDDNSDRLSYTIEASNDSGLTFQEIVKDFKSPEYQWNTREFPDGEYILRVTASDGFEKATATSSKFFVRNFLPVITIDRKVFTNQASISLKGSVGSPFSRIGGERRNIASIEMSLDSGKTWQAILAKDGSFDSPAEEFVLNLQNLTEGEHEILLRSFDTKRSRGRAKISLTADFTPPVAPRFSDPLPKSIFGNSEDFNTEKPGLQIVVRGEGEPNAIVRGSVGKEAFETIVSGAGKFSAEVTLPSHGENTIKAGSYDLAGNKNLSEADLLVISNNPSDIKFLRPRENGGLNHKAEIVFEIKDQDLDLIKDTAILYRRAGGGQEIAVAKNVKGNSFLWDVSGIPEGPYDLIIEASDGLSYTRVTRTFTIDNIIPDISFIPLEKNSFSKEFTLEMRGSARDNFSGIEFVEYSIDRKNWYKATLTSGFRLKEATFRVRHPFKLSDGKYEISFRASDSAGNVSLIPEPQKIIIDTTPPRIGSYTLSSQNLNILPQGEVFEIPDGTAVDFKISLEEDTASSTIYIGEQAQKLEKSLGLWGLREVGLPNYRGETSIVVSAQDNLGNSIIKEIGKIKILPNGRILSSESGNPLEGVKMSISIFDERSSSWLDWQAESYGLQNPVSSNEKGEYSMLLPSGKYEVLIRKSGFKRLKISGIEVFNPQFITKDFTLEPRKGVRGYIENIIEKFID